MGASKARRSARKRPTSASRPRCSNPPPPGGRDLRRENERLTRENESLQKRVAEREQQIADAQKQIADAERQIADLERQLAGYRKNSTNSSKPPSSDRLAGGSRPCQRRKKSDRKPGGQTGHAGAHRPLVPPERVNQVVPVLPPECKHCGQALPQQMEGVQTVGEVQRHQVTELPPIQAHITEYQCPKVVCPNCGQGTRAPLPEEVRDQSGPQLTALIAYLTVVCRLPRRVVERFLEAALGISISLGSTQKRWEEASQAVAEPCQELEQQLKKEPVLNADDTSWSGNGERRAIWALVAASFVYYVVAQTKSWVVLLHLLGAHFAGILCSDRGGAYLKYRKYAQGLAQFCWAHLKRNILGIQDFAKATVAGRFCRDALALHARLFRLWPRFRGDEIDRKHLIEKSIPIQKRFFSLAERYLDSNDNEVRALATALYEHCDRLFTFIEHPGVEPTNNAAERALRIAVEWRKTSFGNRSQAGELATARLLTATQTCAIEQRNALTYLTEAIRRRRCGQPAPSLLPQQR